jgi:hypothetical protein
MARTALGAVRYANTRRLPPHQAQVKTSNTNVLRSNRAQSTRGVLSFFGSLLTAAWGVTLAPSSPAWGNVIPFAGNDPVERLFIAGQRLHGPVRQADLLPQESDAAVPGYVTGAKLPRSASFLSVAGKVVVTSVQRTESGQTLVRLFNSQASKEAIKLSVPAGPALTAAQAVRLDGKPLRSKSPDGG